MRPYTPLVVVLLLLAPPCVAADGPRDPASEATGFAELRSCPTNSAVLVLEGWDVDFRWVPDVGRGFTWYSVATFAPQFATATLQPFTADLDLLVYQRASGSTCVLQYASTNHANLPEAWLGLVDDSTFFAVFARQPLLQDAPAASGYAPPFFVKTETPDPAAGILALASLPTDSDGGAGSG